MKKLLVQENHVATREYEWGTARRFMSVTARGWEQYLSESTLPTQGLSLGQATINPQCRKPPSVHAEEEEAYLFLKGTGVCTVGEEEIPVGPGSVVYIPAGVFHALANHGDQPLEYIFALGFRQPT